MDAISTRLSARQERQRMAACIFGSVTAVAPAAKLGGVRAAPAKVGLRVSSD